MGAFYFFLQLKDIFLWLISISFLTFLYSAPKLSFKPFVLLRKVAVAKTAFLALTWLFVTCILPIFIYSSNFNTDQQLYIFSRFFFIYAICILFDYRDKEKDRKEGIRSLVTELNENGIHFIFFTSMLICIISSTLFLQVDLSAELLAFIIPVLILSFLYYPSKSITSDYWYYFLLDGLMMLPGILLIIIRI